MANLSYDKTIFTKVNKWDSNYSYNGILLSDKINQKNGQDYKLVDVIDLDWDGMWVPFANAYVNDTKDLLDILKFMDPTERFFTVNEKLTRIESSYVDKATMNDIIAQMQFALVAGENITISSESIISTYNLPTFSYISDYYTTYSYLNEYSYSKVGTLEAIDEKLQELIGNADESFDTIQEIADWISRQCEYVEVSYEDIDFSYGDRYYIYEGGKYVEVNQEYVTANPNKQYYLLVSVTASIADIIKKLRYLENLIGTQTPNGDNTFSYTGILAYIESLRLSDVLINSHIYNINNSIGDIRFNLNRLETTLNSTTTLAQSAKITADAANELANAANITASTALEHSTSALSQIGYEYVPAYFSPVTNEFAQEYQGNTYIQVGESYVNTEYSSYLETQWFVWAPTTYPTGMHKEISDLSYGLERSLYNLHVDNSNAMSYVYLSLSPDQYSGSNERTIEMNAKIANFSVDDRIIYEDGLMTASYVNGMISYVIEWVDL